MAITYPGRRLTARRSSVVPDDEMAARIDARLADMAAQLTQLQTDVAAVASAVNLMLASQTKT